MLRQAVESNLDAIHDRLPVPLRRGRGWPRRILTWSWRVAVPVVLVLTLGVLAQRIANAGRLLGLSLRAEDAEAARDEALAHDGILPGTPVSPDVLGLGVRRIVVDAGHGGRDAGAVGPDGLTEKTVTLDIAQRVEALMVAQGFDVVLTRDEDETVSLQQRAFIANSLRGDLFVSIHLNALDSPSVRGVETYYLGPSDGDETDAVAQRENQHAGYALADLRALLERIYGDTRRDASRRLATSVQGAVLARLREASPGLTDRHVKMAPFVVLVATEMPAILAEVSCLSNADESRRLGTPGYRQRIADALASGVTSFARARS